MNIQPIAPSYEPDIPINEAVVKPTYRRSAYRRPEAEMMETTDVVKEIKVAERKSIYNDAGELIDTQVYDLEGAAIQEVPLEYKDSPNRAIVEKIDNPHAVI